MLTEWDRQGRTLRTCYDHQDFHRAGTYHIPGAKTPVGYVNGRIFFEIELAPGEEWHTCGDLTLELGQQVMRPIYAPCAQRRSDTPLTGLVPSSEGEPPHDFDERQARWLGCCPNVLTPNEHVYRMYRQAVEDMGALRIYDLDVSDEANTVIRGIFDAARRFEAYRLPEVFAGLQREEKGRDFPAIYPGGANVPQAWASGSIFHMVQTILGLRADAPRKRLYVNPTLPAWLPEIEFRDVRVGSCSISLRFWREGEHSRWEVCDMRADPGTAEEERITVLDEREEFSTPYESNPALLAEFIPDCEVYV